MNNLNDIIVGLDIGTTKIACFIGQRTEADKIKIIGFGKTDSKGVERGVVKNIKDTSKSIIKAVQTASEQAGVEVTEVYVGIAGQHIKSQQNMGTIVIPPEQRLIKQEDVDRLIEEQHNMLLNPGEDIIHIFPQNFVVDGEELSPEVNPVGVSGKQLKSNFHIVTGNTVNLRNIHDSVERAGLRIKGVVLEPIASAYAVLDDDDREAGVALVDIGGGTTDIAIFKEGIIRHTTVLPLAGNAITNDIKDGCKIMRPQAETLKTRFGSCLPQNVSENDIISIPGLHTQPAREISMRTLATIIKARTETILEQVDFEIRKSHLEKDIFAGIVLTGGGAQLRHLKELTEFMTGIDTRVGLPDAHLDKNTDPEIINTMYATGIGLVLHGFYELDRMRLQEIEYAENSDGGMPMEELANQPEPEVQPIEEEDPDKVEKNDHDDSVLERYNGDENEDEVKEKKRRKKLFDKETPKGNPEDEKGSIWKRAAQKSKDALETYFKRVFIDGSISDEGSEERDL